MSFLSLIGIATAHAAESSSSAAAQPPHQASFVSMLPMLVLIVVVFYLLLIRPQQKRAKTQRTLLEQIAIGDEVVTIGGIIGKVAKLRDTFIILSISKGVEITIRKAAVESILPKGTMETAD